MSLQAMHGSSKYHLMYYILTGAIQLDYATLGINRCGCLGAGSSHIYSFSIINQLTDWIMKQLTSIIKLLLKLKVFVFYACNKRDYFYFVMGLDTNMSQNIKLAFQSIRVVFGVDSCCNIRFLRTEHRCKPAMNATKIINMCH